MRPCRHWTLRSLVMKAIFSTHILSPSWAEQKTITSSKYMVLSTTYFVLTYLAYFGMYGPSSIRKLAHRNGSEWRWLGKAPGGWICYSRWCECQSWKKIHNVKLSKNCFQPSIQAAAWKMIALRLSVKRFIDNGVKLTMLRALTSIFDAITSTFSVHICSNTWEKRRHWPVYWYSYSNNVLNPSQETKRVKSTKKY